MDLVDKIYYSLKEVMPKEMKIKYLLRPETFPCISYHKFNDTPIFWGDGNARRSMKSFQIDIWDKTNMLVVSRYADKVIKSLKKEGFILSRKSESYEDNIKCYRMAIVFNYYDKEEEDEQESI